MNSLVTKSDGDKRWMTMRAPQQAKSAGHPQD
jgi:hypothetical protein